MAKTLIMTATPLFSTLQSTTLASHSVSCLDEEITRMARKASRKPDSGNSFDEKIPRLAAELHAHIAESARRE